MSVIIASGDDLITSIVFITYHTPYESLRIEVYLKAHEVATLNKKKKCVDTKTQPWNKGVNPLSMMLYYCKWGGYVNQLGV